MSVARVIAYATVDDAEGTSDPHAARCARRVLSVTRLRSSDPARLSRPSAGVGTQAALKVSLGGTAKGIDGPGNSEAHVNGECRAGGPVGLCPEAQRWSPSPAALQHRACVREATGATQLRAHAPHSPSSVAAHAVLAAPHLAQLRLLA